MRMLSADTTLTSHRAHRLSIHSPAAPTMPSAPTTISKKTAAVGIPSEITGASKLPRLRSASKTTATVTGSGRALTWGLLRSLHHSGTMVPPPEVWRSARALVTQPRRRWILRNEVLRSSSIKGSANFGYFDLRKLEYREVRGLRGGETAREHPGRVRHIPWEGRDDHQERPGTGGPRGRGRCAVLRPIRVAAPVRRGRVDPVRRPRPYAATAVAVFRPALARRTGRVPLRAFWRGDRDRGGRSSPAPSRRRGVLASWSAQRPPCREPLEGALHLPHLRHPGATRCHPLPRPRRDPLRLRGRVFAAGAHRRDPNRGTAHLRRWVVAAAARRRDPDQGREP